MDTTKICATLQILNIKTPKARTKAVHKSNKLDKWKQNERHNSEYTTIDS